VDLGYLEARDWGVESGRWFEPDEAKSGVQVALLGQTVAKQLFPDVDPIGHEVRIKNVPFKVIGMLARKGQSTAGQDQDDALIVPLNAGRRVLGSNQAKLRSVAAILVKVRDGESMAQASEDVEGLLRQRHRLPLQDLQYGMSAVTSTKEVSQNTVHPPCIGRTCFAPNGDWHLNMCSYRSGANRKWRPNGCRSPAAFFYNSCSRP
jgi:putative ABC transport system permease protein